ncbi:MAG: MATE family efflux transporter [Lachnospiraceae bacterium]|nr:MATE family efflux transporter [Lachnospiraceae bacterium]
MENKENKMGVMPEGKLLMNMSLPIMISMFVQALYNIVDSIFVARISEDALTAVSLAFSLQTLMIAVATGTGVGLNALVSRALGEKKPKRASTVAQNGIFVYIVSYIVVAIVGCVAVKPFYTMQTSAGQEAIFNYGVEYLSIVMIFSFGLFMQICLERLLQATGRSFYTMLSQTTGAVINIILDPILIFGMCGMPAMGIKGAAIATAVGQIVAAVEALLWNILKNHDIHLSFKGFRPNFAIIKNIYKIGLPSIVMQSIGSVMTTGMNYILMGLSSTGTAVFGVYFKLQSFFFMPIFGLNNGMIPIISYNYGARKKSRMLNTLKYSYIVAFAFAFIGFLGFEIIPDKLLLMFDASEKMVEIGVVALRIIGIHYLIAWYCIVTGSMFQAVGKAAYSMYVSIARQMVVLLPVAYILAQIGGLTAIWWCFPIAEVMSMIMTIIFFGRVKKTVLNQF